MSEQPPAPPSQPLETWPAPPPPRSWGRKVVFIVLLLPLIGVAVSPFLFPEFQKNVLEPHRWLVMLACALCGAIGFGLDQDIRELDGHIDDIPVRLSVLMGLVTGGGVYWSAKIWLWMRASVLGEDVYNLLEIAAVFVIAMGIALIAIVLLVIILYAFGYGRKAA